MSKPRRNDLLIPLLMVIADFIAIVGAFYVSYMIRFVGPLKNMIPVTKGYPPLEAYLFGALIVAPLWIALFNGKHVYGARREIDFSSEFLQIIRVVSFGMLLVMSIAFLYREFSYSRVVFGVQWILSIVSIFAGRIAVLSYEKSLYRRGKELRNLLIVGANTTAQKLALKITQDVSLGYRLAGYLSDEEERIASVQTNRLGDVGEVHEVVIKERIESIIVCIGAGEYETLAVIFNLLLGKNVQLLLEPEIIGISPTLLRLREMFGVPFLSVKDVPMTTWHRIAKRLFDIVFSGIILLGFAPFALFIAMFIWMESRRPIIYKQVRIGLDGKKFVLYKYRTMKFDAEKESGPTWTKKDDVRVTRMGRFLRRFSLDEIPQFLNVLMGDMSVVGPRPERPEFVSQFVNYVPKYLERHRLKTGLTGWAQVNGLRGDVPIVERTKYDLYYIENWSLKLDLRIIFKTLRAVLFGKDAY